MKLPQRGALYTEGVSSVRLWFEIIVPLFERPRNNLFLGLSFRERSAQRCNSNLRPSRQRWYTVRFGVVLCRLTYGGNWAELIAPVDPWWGGGVHAPYLQTLDGPFSAVSTPPIARVGAFFSNFRDLQDLRTSAPLRLQNFRKKYS